MLGHSIPPLKMKASCPNGRQSSRSSDPNLASQNWRKVSPLTTSYRLVEELQPKFPDTTPDLQSRYVAGVFQPAARNCAQRIFEVLKHVID